MNRHKISMFGTVLCLVGLGFSDTASGQTITTTPSLASGLSFQVQSGGASAFQNLTVNTSNGSTTIVLTVPSSAPWLSVGSCPSGNTCFVNTSGAGTVVLPVTVNTTGLATGQTVSTSIPMMINQVSGSQVFFPVSLTVGTPSILSANPATLTFSAIQNATSGSPTATAVTISSSAQALFYNVSATTTSGGNWILLTNTTGQSSSSSPGFQVSVNPSGLPTGNFSGTVLVQSTTTGDSVTIPVTLAVNAGATLNVTGTPANFIFQSGAGEGGFSAETQTLMISTNSGTLNYSVTPTAISGPTLTTNWLVLSSTGGTATGTPQPLYLSLSYQGVVGLPAGTYQIQLAIAPTGVPNPGNTTDVTVTLVVSNNPLLNVNNRQLTFSVPFGTTTSQSQQITVSSSSSTTPIPYNVVSNQAWLIVVPPSNGTTALNPTFSVYVDAAGLAVSNTPYTATLTVTPQNGDQNLYNIPITVSLTVTSATTQILASPDQLLFSYQTTQAPPQAQLVELTTTAATGFSVNTTTMAASNCPTTNWLSATPSQTLTSANQPATLSVSVAVTGMTGGSCSGTVIVTYNNGQNANTTVLIPVTVDISATALLTVTPPFGFGAFTATYGSTSLPPSQIAIASTDLTSQLGFSAVASTPGAPVSWLSLAGSQGTTPGFLTINILPNGLPVGTYSGSITIYPGNSANLPSGPVTIPVVLTVSTNTTVTASPTSLSFTQPQNATTPPTPKTITLTAAGGSTTFTIAVTSVTAPTTNWLQVTPGSGTATGTITASVANNTLSPGTYVSNITVTFQNAATPAIQIPVTLTVTAAQTLTVSPNPLNFSYTLGGSAPATQTLNVFSTGGALPITIAFTSSSGWLSVTPTSATTPATEGALPLTVSINPATFTGAGTFTGSITISSTGQPSITVPVNVTVTGAVIPTLTTIFNSASGAPGSISPGELITLKGTNLGPTTAAIFTVGAGNTLSSTLSGVQVLFDGIPGTPTYVSANQINVIVPYEIAGRSTTNVTVTYNSQVSTGISEFVANQAPGIYTFSATGAGQASVLNQNGTYNGPSSGLVINGQNITTSPAAQGSVISVYMTGGGQTNPASSTGTVTPTNTLYRIPGTIAATINGVAATVEFAGAAPGLVTGVVQVNLLVPIGVTGSGLPLAITINGSTTLSGPTVAVQ